MRRDTERKKGGGSKVERKGWFGYGKVLPGSRPGGRGCWDCAE